MSCPVRREAESLCRHFNEHAKIDPHVLEQLLLPEYHTSTWAALEPLLAQCSTQESKHCIDYLRLMNSVGAIPYNREVPMTEDQKQMFKRMHQVLSIRDPLEFFEIKSRSNPLSWPTLTELVAKYNANIRIGNQLVKSKNATLRRTARDRFLPHVRSLGDGFFRSLE